MILYDISQEVFHCEVYPSDPAPKREKVMEISGGDSCNLTKFEMCAHNGTHMDAPYHFIEEGKTVEQLDLGKCIGEALVVEAGGELDQRSAAKIMKSGMKRILIKGKAVVTAEAAEEFNRWQAVLIGVESQSVGPVNSPEQVHRILLSQEVILLEGLVLSEVPEGRYFLSAVPLNLGGADGAPVRAVLVKWE